MQLVSEKDYLEHHGILGQKWGIRRFQNKDGSLTARGRKRYLNDDGTFTEKGQKKFRGSDGSLTEDGKKAIKGEMIRRGAEQYEAATRGGEMPYSRASHDALDKKLMSELQDAHKNGRVLDFMEKHSREYAEAEVKDLGLAGNQEVIDIAEKMFRDEWGLKPKNEANDTQEISVTKKNLSEHGFEENSNGEMVKYLSAKDGGDATIEVEVDDRKYGNRSLGQRDLEILAGDVSSKFDSYSKDIRNQMIKNILADPIMVEAAYSNVPGLTFEEKRNRLKHDLGKALSGKDLEAGAVYFRILGDGTGEVGYDDGGAYGGHFLLADYDWKTGRMSKNIQTVG